MGPCVRITFTRPFAIGKTEVTWDQWEACVRDRWCDGPGVELALRTNADGTPNTTFVDWGDVIWTGPWIVLTAVVVSVVASYVSLLRYLRV